MSQTRTAAHADSIDGQDPLGETTEKKVKSRRPANTAFRQQRLKAWQPILTPKTVLPLFFVIGIVFAPIGGLLLWASSMVEEIVIDYSDCLTQSILSDDIKDFTPIPSDKYYSYFKTAFKEGQVPTWKHNTTDVPYGAGIAYNMNVNKPYYKNGSDVCSIEFAIPNNIGPGVFLYYRLTNFYQNHRRYVKSLDTNQLAGDAVVNDTIKSGTCDPLRNDAVTGNLIYPCGIIANSVFNDTIMSPYPIQPSTSGPQFIMADTGIAWDSDKDLYKKTSYPSPYDKIAVPPNWYERWGPTGYSPDNPPPDLHADEGFQVWMRTAGLPAFSKLARRNDDIEMPTGRYRIDIIDNFPVNEYGGTKSIVLSTKTVMGGRNPFLGIAYVVVAGLCVILGVVFAVANLIKPRKLGDHTYLTWNNDQNTGTSTGMSRPGNGAA